MLVVTKNIFEYTNYFSVCIIRIPSAILSEISFNLIILSRSYARKTEGFSEKQKVFREHNESVLSDFCSAVFSDFGAPLQDLSCSPRG